MSKSIVKEALDLFNDQDSNKKKVKKQKKNQLSKLNGKPCCTVNASNSLFRPVLTDPYPVPNPTLSDVRILKAAFKLAPQPDIVITFQLFESNLVHFLVSVFILLPAKISKLETLKNLNKPLHCKVLSDSKIIKSFEIDEQQADKKKQLKQKLLFLKKISKPIVKYADLMKNSQAANKDKKNRKEEKQEESVFTEDDFKNFNKSYA